MAILHIFIGMGKGEGLHMISNQTLQSTLDGMMSIAHVELCVTDTE